MWLTIKISIIRRCRLDPGLYFLQCGGQEASFTIPMGFEWPGPQRVEPPVEAYKPQTWGLPYWVWLTAGFGAATAIIGGVLFYRQQTWKREHAAFLGYQPV